MSLSESDSPLVDGKQAVPCVQFRLSAVALANATNTTPHAINLFVDDKEVATFLTSHTHQLRMASDAIGRIVGTRGFVVYKQPGLLPIPQ